MTLVTLFLLVCITGVLIIPFINVKMKGITAMTAIGANTVISGYFAIQSLTGQAICYILPGSVITGPIPVRIDALSGWFILIVNFIFITGGWYGLFYMNAYKYHRKKIALHAIAFLILHASLISLLEIGRAHV